MRDLLAAIPLQKEGVCSVMFSSLFFQTPAQSDWISPVSHWYCKFANYHKNMVIL